MKFTGQSDLFAEMSPPLFVANRTRSRKIAKDSGVWAPNSSQAGNVFLDRRKNKRLRNGRIKAGDLFPPMPESLFGRRQECCDVVVVDEDEETDIGRVSHVEIPVSRRTRSKLGFEQKLRSDTGASFAVAARFPPPPIPESANSGLKSDGSDLLVEVCAGNDVVFIGERVEASASNLEFEFDTKEAGTASTSTDISEEASSRVTDAGILDLGKDGSFDPMILDEAVDIEMSGLAHRVRSLRGLEKENHGMHNPVPVNLFENQLPDGDHTADISGVLGSEASMGDGESCSCSYGPKSKEIVGSSFMMKTFSGLRVLVPLGNDSCDSNEADDTVLGVVKRTRSHFPSTSRKIGNNVGTIGNPYLLDHEHSCDGNDCIEYGDAGGIAKIGVYIESSSSSDSDGDNSDDQVEEWEEEEEEVKEHVGDEIGDGCCHNRTGKVSVRVRVKEVMGENEEVKEHVSDDVDKSGDECCHNCTGKVSGRIKVDVVMNENQVVKGPVNDDEIGHKCCHNCTGKVNDRVRVKEAVNEKVEETMEKEHQPKMSKRKKHIRAHKKSDFYNELMDALLKEGDKPSCELFSQKVTPEKDDKPHPLLFSFEDTKENLEIEVDEHHDLWAEFNVLMTCRNIGTFSQAQVNNDGFTIGEFDADQSTLCSPGEHHLILDEQIGIICQFCPFVKSEIKDISPPFGKTVRENYSKKSFTNKGFSFLGGLPFQDAKVDSEDSMELSNGTVWDIVCGIKKTMYPHQQEGFEFIWKNLAGSIVLEELKKPPRPDELGGCVISHAPGTGKTRLTIVFLQTFMKVYPNCRPVIIAPRSMILGWENEFKKWKVGISLHILNRTIFSGNEDGATLQLGRTNNLHGSHWSRLVKLYSWMKGNSILVLSYTLFEKLVERDSDGDEEAQIRRILTEMPGLVILDEGHTPRNEHTLIWKSLEKVKTERRIILSGTPFQNNFSELYNTLCLVRPKFVDKLSSTEICQQKSKLISDNTQNVSSEKKARGKWASLTNSISENKDSRVEVLRSIINPFVHVHKGSILKSLPGLKDCLVYLHPPPLQKRLLESVQKLESGTHFKQEYNLSMISIHPSLLLECSLSELVKSVVDEQLLEVLRLDPNEGVKTRFVMELVRLSCAMNERVLIFSQYIQPLNFLKDHLKFCFSWTEGKEVVQMDGNVSMKQRQSSIDSFNDLSNDVKVLLASTKACCEGINLVGASRVVLLDVVWNPSVERQAISRAYRLGQQKMVYTYHLITSGTPEGDKYCRQVEKERVSELIFSCGDFEYKREQSSFKISEDRILQEMLAHESLKNIFVKIIYQPKKSNFMESL